MHLSVFCCYSSVFLYVLYLNTAVIVCMCAFYGKQEKNSFANECFRHSFKHWELVEIHVVNRGHSVVQNYVIK